MLHQDSSLSSHDEVRWRHVLKCIPRYVTKQVWSLLSKRHQNVARNLKISYIQFSLQPAHHRGFISFKVGNIWHNIDCQCLDKKSSTGAKSSLGGRDAPGGGVEGEGGGKCQNIMNKMFLAGEVSSSPLTLVLSIFDECEIESDTTKITYKFLHECLFCLNLEPIAIIGRPFDSTLKIKISSYVIFAWRRK